MEKAKVKVFFTGLKPDTPTWPYINYDYRKRAREIMELLRQNLSEVEFSETIAPSAEEAVREVKSDKDMDGYLIFLLSLWSNMSTEVVKLGRPTLLVDDLYGGSGEFLRAYSFVTKENLPVVGIASSNFQDVVDGVKLFSVMKQMRQSKILIVRDSKLDKEMLASVKETFGTEVIRITSEELNRYYQEADDKEAERWKEKWIAESLRVIEPTEQEIFKSARMHLALKKAMEQKGADAVTVDCLGLYYSDKLFAYPCLSFFQLNNEGSTGVCEADVDSTVTQLMLKYLTGRPGYVSDPVIDIGSGQIIYAHCVATNRVYGPEGLPNPYLIRSHSEDRKGASVQSLMPLGQTVTSVKVSVREKMLAIHQGKTVANVEEDKACRTKLAAEADVEKILENYNFDKFSWHRVTVYGDFRKQVLNLARLWGLKTIEEDRT